MLFYNVMHLLHLLTTMLVLGGYIFVVFFWWPVLPQALPEVRLQVRCIGQTLRRFLTTVVLALTLQLLTGGLYLLPPRYQAVGTGEALAVFHRLLLYKLIFLFLLLILVPMQLFSIATKLTRIDAGIYPFDEQVVERLRRRFLSVSYCIIALLLIIVILSTYL